MFNIQQYFQESLAVKNRFFANPNLMETLRQACQLCANTYQQGGKLLLAGNGGSAADAQHIAAELVSRFLYDRPGLPAIALTTDTSILTAVGNDYGYEAIFSRQVEALGQAGDVFLAISTSGHSPNILKALHVAHAKGLKTIGLSGENPSPMQESCDLLLQVPSTTTSWIQEVHIMIGHILCAYVETELFPKTD